MAKATPKGIRNENGPKTLSPNVTATALAFIISGIESTVIYAIFMKTYKAVTIGTLIIILLGMFLKYEWTNYNADSIYTSAYTSGRFISSVTIVTADL